VTRTPVDSSSIRSLGHDETTGKLHVEFSSGAVYEYSGVDRAMFDTLLASKSIGKAFAQTIRAGGFSFVKLKPEKSEAAS